MLRTLVPIFLFILIATAFAVFTVGSSAPNGRAPSSSSPYECGIEPLTDSPGWQ